MYTVKHVIVKLSVFTAMLIGLPLLGVHLAGYSIDRYLEFPPRTQYVAHAPFSWYVFVLVALLIAAVCIPLAVRLFVARRQYRAPSDGSRSGDFPWWGWTGVATCMAAWIVAWTRFPLFEPLQEHSFTALWLSYILIINGWNYRRTGRCMMLNRPLLFICLFPASTVFWWYFEYLNRFVQNWHYVAVQYDSWTYFRLASLPFSTVLPAVLSTQEWILSHNWFRRGFDRFAPMSRFPSRSLAWILLGISGITLGGIGVWPDYLFPVLWISPFVIIVCLQVILGESPLLAEVAHGRWSSVLSASLAALVCGFFWEMWNYHSLMKWHYSVPFVHRYQVFEMPILGYAGYLTFGLECLVIGNMVEGLIKSRTIAVAKRNGRFVP